MCNYNRSFGLIKNKTYDGTTTATVSESTSDIIGGDSVTISESASFDTKNAGTGKTWFARNNYVHIRHNRRTEGNNVFAYEHYLQTFLPCYGSPRNW